MKKLSSVLITILGLAVGCEGDKSETQVVEMTTVVTTGDPCVVEVSECASDSVRRTCSGNEGATWMYVACGDNEHCADGECIENGPVCVVGTSRCAGSNGVEACLNEEGDPTWLEFPCRSDQRCHQGVCVSEDAVFDAGSDAGDGG